MPLRSRMPYPRRMAGAAFATWAWADAFRGVVAVLTEFAIIAATVATAAARAATAAMLSRAENRAGPVGACLSVPFMLPLPPPTSDQKSDYPTTHGYHIEAHSTRENERRGTYPVSKAPAFRREYPLSMVEFWNRLIGAQSAPPGWVVAASAAVALLIVLSPRLWRLTRIAITIAHESGHAVASLLSGRRLEGIRLHADTSGETVSRGKRTGPGIIVTALAGYVTPPLLGIGASALLAAHRVTLLLSLLLVLLAVTLLLVRNWYGGLAVLVTGGALFSVIWFADPALRAAFAFAVAWFLLFGGVRPVVELARTRTKAVRLPPGRRLPMGRSGPGMSDADQLAWLTRIPAGVWVALFALIATGALVLGAWLLIPWPTHLPTLQFPSGK